MKWLVLLDDPDLASAYRSELDAPNREDALRRVAAAAVEHTRRAQPERANSAAVLRAAFPDGFLHYGVAVPLEGDGAPVTLEIDPEASREGRPLGVEQRRG